jgi:SAM-dependent methyltransferase
MALNKKQDAYGRLVHDYFNGARVTEIVERDDGFIAPSGGPVTYFAPYGKWPRFQQRAMAFVRGRVLDIGCGPGRVALYLQQRGHSVLAVDNSPLAVRTARLRGVRDAQVLSVTQLNRRLGLFPNTGAIIAGTVRADEWPANHGSALGTKTRSLHGLT